MSTEMPQIIITNFWKYRRKLYQLASVYFLEVTTLGLS